MPLYFAYGSNMDRVAMAARCPASRPLGIARLARHRLFIMESGHASVTRDPRAEVWGMLWDLALSDVPALDRYEEVGSGLYVKLNQPVITEAGPRRALVYVGRSGKPGRARPGYLEGVLAAAREAGLPPPYLAMLARMPSGGSAAAEPARINPKVRPTRAAPSPSGKPWTS